MNVQICIMILTDTAIAYMQEGSPVWGRMELFGSHEFNHHVRKDAVPGILKDLSGKAYSSCITPILGPSGSGKTSFFNVIANRINNRK